jgi:hypothetical protein
MYAVYVAYSHQGHPLLVSSDLATVDALAQSNGGEVQLLAVVAIPDQSPAPAPVPPSPPTETPPPPSPTSPQGKEGKK